MRKTFLMLIILVCATAANAGLIDLFNGVKIGMPLPSNDLKYLAASPDPLAKLQLIDFWATWCAPCRESIPKLNAWHAKYASRGLAVVGVTRESAEIVEPFLKKVPIHYPVGLEQRQVLHDALKIKGLPYAIFVSRSGNIVWRGPPDEIDEKLIEALLH